MKIKQVYWLALLLLPLHWGCYPNGPQSTSDLDLVLTNYSSTYDFSQKKTYALPDSVIDITGENVDNPQPGFEPEFLSPVYSDAILTAIKQNMNIYGWNQVDKNDHPDVILLVSAMTTTTVFYYYDWWYWDWWYPGWYPGWGWYYPGYYPSYVTGYRSGSVLIQMTDPSATPQDANVPVSWTSIFNGLVQGSTADVVARIQKSIDQAYAQSPYLKH
jgi:hypothetical protein